ncbi:MAG: hypothetical protein M3Y80_08790 [Verrucomicrobiota bacterium]|nr:hypothetical protein [Verrucomicrobiota bacterium]
MNELDQKIQAALQRGSAADEPNLAEEVITVFRGQHRWMHAVMVIVTLLVLAAGVWAGLQFYHAEVVREQLLWGAAALIALLTVSFIKVWFWLEMHTNRILREVKRVELLFVTRGGRD